jgi:hypothetical protein
MPVPSSESSKQLRDEAAHLPMNICRPNISQWLIMSVAELPSQNPGVTPHDLVWSELLHLILSVQFNDGYVNGLSGLQFLRV